MAAAQPKDDLHHYLRQARAALLWKLDGLDEYDVRRPLTPTGTNLLGLVKHVASVELEYLGDVSGRPSGEPLPWMGEGAEPNADMWVAADVPRQDVVDLYQRAWAHGDVTIEELSLDATGVVPWWPEHRRTVTLDLILVHLIAETNRHAGHADIVREAIDGAAGHRAEVDNLAPGGSDWWEGYAARVEAAARGAGTAARRGGSVGPD